MSYMARARPEAALAQQRACGGARLPARRMAPQAVKLLSLVTAPGWPFPLVYRAPPHLRRQSLSASLREAGSGPLTSYAWKSRDRGWLSCYWGRSRFRARASKFAHNAISDIYSQRPWLCP